MRRDEVGTGEEQERFKRADCEPFCTLNAAYLDGGSHNARSSLMKIPILQRRPSRFQVRGLSV